MSELRDVQVRAGYVESRVCQAGERLISAWAERGVGGASRRWRQIIAPNLGLEYVPSVGCV